MLESLAVGAPARELSLAHTHSRGCSFASDAAEERLEIARLGHSRMHRMIGRLPSELEHLHEAAAMPSGRLHGREQLRLRQMVRAGAGDEEPLGLDERQSKLIELAVGRLPLGNVLLALDEGGRIEDHRIEARAALVQSLQRVESVLAQAF